MASSPTCSLNPKGAAPADFIDQSKVSPDAWNDLAAVTNVYGCVQMPDKTTTNQLLWFCASDNPANAKAVYSAPCPLTLKEQQSPCTQSYPVSGSGHTTVQGCLVQPNHPSSYCRSAGQQVACTPNEPAHLSNNTTSGSPTSDGSAPVTKSSNPVPIIVGVVVGILAAVALLAAFLFWRRRRARADNPGKLVMAPQSVPGSGMQQLTPKPSSTFGGGNTPVMQQASYNTTPPLPQHGEAALAAGAAGAAMSTPPALSHADSGHESSPMYNNGNGRMSGEYSPYASSPMAGGPMGLANHNADAMYQQQHDVDNIELANREHDLAAPVFLNQERGQSPMSMHSAAPADSRPLRGMPSSSSLKTDLALAEAAGAGAAVAAAAHNNGRPSGVSGQSSSPTMQQKRASRSSFSFVPPRPSLSVEAALPNVAATASPRASSDMNRKISTSSLLDGGQSPAASAPFSEAGRNSISTEDEEFPRPYRTYLNIEGGAPEFRDVLPNLPAGNQEGLAKKKFHAVAPPIKLQAPPTYLVEYHPLDFNNLVPIRSTMQLKHDSPITRSKAGQPLYSIEELLNTYDNLCSTLIDMVAQSFHIMFQNPDAPNLSGQLFKTVTHGQEPPADPQMAWTGTQFAFLSLFMKILASDFFTALTTPLRMEEYCKLIKQHIPELKKDIKQNLSTQLVFQAFDHFLSSPTLSSHLIAHLQPTLSHANTTLSGLFHAHGLPPPSPESFDELLQSLLDWLVRLKREYPAVGLFAPHAEGQVQTEWMQVAGGEGNRVAFTLWLGLWDAEVGQMGYPAQIWTK
ncbi:hypothetical protein RI367_002130 [Sorochytrium milnesiophthora]